MHSIAWSNMQLYSGMYMFISFQVFVNRFFTTTFDHTSISLIYTIYTNEDIKTYSYSMRGEFKRDWLMLQFNKFSVIFKE